MNADSTRIRNEAIAISNVAVREEVLKVIDAATDNAIECIATPPAGDEPRSIDQDWETAFYLTLERMADECSPEALQWLRARFGDLG